ncbi:spore germination protein [Clostridium coskatii]|uniref:Spore germination protein B1 n=1 Tax=Clostridium coskatii TaxID=1705578 RepID=A0A162JA35_9CLOT|nr:spore germination protein [Clostridium coskatii]OAA92445.1 Spore germination protein B1 [Clostridium coskatii]OBR89928.1 spore germination protein B1 [Clostridium coskatii]
MRNKNGKANNKISHQNYTKNCIISNSIQLNISLIKDIFNDNDTLIVRYFENQKNNNVKCCIIFFQEMIDSETINANIIKPIIENTYLNEKNSNVENILNHIIFSNNVNKTKDVNEIIESILNGNTVLFLEGASEALIISTVGWKPRAIEEPEGEKILRGPREGFTESLMVNLSMIRRKLLIPELKFKVRVLGTQTQTKICLCYINGIVNNKILNELNKRLESIDIDGIIASSYIQELINDEPFSPFKTIGSTERPDIVAAKLLEGRIAIIVEGTPIALTVPHIFIELFQSNDDYYINFYFSSISRLLRMLSFIITISLPSIFIALTTFHIEAIPTPLVISITAARQGIPFPITLEALLLLIAFEILRETGVRMPNQIGQAFSIVGALVLGQASVDARFVSAPMIIIIALTGITGLAIPKIKGGSILLRIILLMLSSILGLYGFVFGIIGILIHLFKMRSFGVPYMLSLMTLNPEDLKDTAIRAPWFYMKYRPKFIAASNLVRRSSGGKKS